MKNTIIKIGYSALAILVLTIPVIALAQLNPGAAGSGTGLSNVTVGTLINTIIRWLLYILGFIAILVFIVAGLMYLTSGGDDAKMEKAKKAVIGAIIGIVVALLGLIILQAIQQLFYSNTIT